MIAQYTIRPKTYPIKQFNICKKHLQMMRGEVLQGVLISDERKMCEFCEHEVKEVANEKEIAQIDFAMCLH